MFFSFRWPSMDRTKEQTNERLAENSRNLDLFSSKLVCQVSAEDLGNNFLVSALHLGQPRAAAVAELARELNDDVPGQSVVADPAAWPFEKSDGDGEPRLASFSLVLACGLPVRALSRLDAACSARSPGLVAIGGSGGSLAGYVWTGGFGGSGAAASSVGEHRVVESRPDDSPRDLRLGCSPALWPPGLLESAREALAKLGGMGDAEHAHVPAAVLVAAAVVAWGQNRRRSSSSLLPRPTPGDRADVASVLSSMRRSSPETRAALEEENFDEAERLLRLALSPSAQASAVPSRVADVLSDPQAVSPPPLPRRRRLHLRSRPLPPRRPSRLCPPRPPPGSGAWPRG